MDYEKILLEMIKKVVTKEWSVAEFESKYYNFYLEDVPDDALDILPERETDLFSAVQQKLEWTHETPSPIGRKDGWIDHKEFVAWVNVQLRKYEAGENIDY